MARQDIIRGLIAVVGGIALTGAGCVISPATNWGLFMMGVFSLTTIAGVALLVRGLICVRRGDLGDFPDTPD